MSSLNVADIRNEFPFFSANPDLAYLDSSATSQIPKRVIDRMNRYDLLEKASPFRGLYTRSVQATEDYEHAHSPREIIVTRNATESLNLAAYTLSASLLHPGDEILVGIMEHHSNLIPWQQAAKRTGAVVRYLPCTPDGLYAPDTLKSMLTPKTRILAVTQMSNDFGNVNDLRTLCQLAHANRTIVVADGCQSVPHMPVDVTDLDVDFLAFSGHKMLSPTGIGVLYGRESLLETLPPFLFGGEMIEYVTTEGAVWAPLPQKYEAGTVNTGGAIALGEAVEYYNTIGFDTMMAQERFLTQRLFSGMLDIPHVHILGSDKPEGHHGIVTFLLDGVHPHDISAILSENGVAIRAGHHCAQPLHTYLGINATSRVSLMFYNTADEVDTFLNLLKQIRGALGYAD